MLAAFDHEELGQWVTSRARPARCWPTCWTGSPARSAPRPSSSTRRWPESWCLSADAGHAIHPNYPQRHDPANRPLLNGGPLLKINANQRYSTDASRGGAVAADLPGRRTCPPRSSSPTTPLPCGSTIGPLTATRLGIRTLDVGVPLLSMHSARELAGTEDPLALSRAMEVFWTGAV